MPTAPTTPIDPKALAAALTLFTSRFVVEDKRDQMHKRLVTAERRGETLVAVERWLHGRHAELEGKDRSPAGIETRFGALSGIYLDDDTSCRTTIRGALELGRGRASLFIGDSGRVALLTRTDQPPVLCAWP